MNINKKQNFSDYSVKALAILGLVGILFLGGIGVIKIADSAPDFFSSIASAVVSITSRFIPADRVVVLASPESVLSGESILLSFTHERGTEEVEGLYSLFYQCQEGVHLERNGEVIFCNTPYNLLDEEKELTLEIFSTEQSSKVVPIEIRFTKNNSTEIDAEGSVDVEVLNDNLTEGMKDTVPTGNAPRTAGTKTEKTELFDSTTTGGGRASNPLGFIDLEARIIEVGTVDRDTNVFTATSSVPVTARAAVRFEVENIGDKTSTNWTFNAVLPSFPMHIYYSDAQIPLAPGDKIEFTLGFDSIKQDGTEATFVVNVDPSNIVRESDETNNIVKVKIDVFDNNS